MTLQRQPNATRSAADRLNVESTRLLCDDGHSAICQAGAGKSQDSRRVDGWTAASLDAASCMRQEYREGGLDGFLTNAADEALDVETTRLRYDNGRKRELVGMEWRIEGTHGVGQV